MIAHASTPTGAVGALVIAVVEPPLGARAMASLGAAAGIATSVGPALRAVHLAAMAGGADREGPLATATPELDPVVHAPRRAEILPLPAGMRDGPPVHAPAGHEGQEVQLLALDLLSRLSPS